MTEHILVLIILTILCCILFFVYSGISRRSGRRTDSGRKADRTRSGMPCPLCGTPLGPGERLASHIYRAGADSLSHIFGCPHCNPTEYGRSAGTRMTRGPGRLQPRICPVCGRGLPQNGYLIARVFERGAGRNADRSAESRKAGVGTGGSGTDPGRTGRPGRPMTHVHVLGCTECRRR